jgi:hypothetical protein
VENFLVVSSADPELRDTWFNAGLAAARSLFGPAAAPVAAFGSTGAFARGAVYQRVNGTGGGAARDEATGSWIVAIGSWFHENGTASGDEAALLRRILALGADSVARELDGFFVIAVCDGRRGETIVINDAAGSCHAFVRQGRGAIAIAGSSLLLAAIGPSTLDPIGAQEFIAGGVIHEDRTLHREVRKIGPGCVVRIRGGEIDGTTRHWHGGMVPPGTLDGDDAVEALSTSLVDVARRIHAVHPRIVSDLTGGYDSRAIAGGLLEAGVPFATTVTGPGSHSDVTIADSVAHAVNLRHLWIALRPALSLADVERATRFTDAAYDAVGYSGILRIHGALAESFDVSLNGSAGEIARGRWWEHLVPGTSPHVPVDAERIARKRFASEPADRSIFDPATRIDSAAHYTAVVRRALRGLETLPNTVQINHIYLSMRMQSWQGRIASSTNRLWPVVSPFLFRTVMSTMLAMTAGIRRRSLVVRRFLAEHQPDLAAIPIDNGYPPMPFSLRTAHRFRGLPAYYFGRAITHARRRAGFTPPRPPETLETMPPRMHLRLDEGVRALLDPARVRLSEIADVRGLRDFLARAEFREFPYDEQWNRLLTVECGLEMLAKVRLAAGRRAEEIAPAPNAS